MSHLYFRRYKLTRPPIGVFNGIDLGVMIVAIVLVPYLYLALPPWVAVVLLGTSFFSVLLTVGEPVLPTRTAIWGVTLLLVGADLGAAWQWRPPSPLFYGTNNLVLLLATIGMVNLWAQAGMRARHVAILAAALALYDFIFTTRLNLMSDVSGQLAHLPFAPQLAWPVGDSGQTLALGLGDVIVLALVPVVMRKAFGPQAGVAAVAINGLAITGLVWLPVFRPAIIFPVMVVLGPLTVAQYFYWRRKGLVEQTFRQYQTVIPLLLLVGLIFSACALAAKPSYPGQTWQTVTTPEALGWSSEKLKLAQAYSESIGSEAVMLIVDGEILAEWGDTTRKIEVRSIMKPLMNALYGIAVQEGKINIQSTLAELNIDDKAPSLTPAEKGARIVDLLKARSGVYHLSGADTPAMREGMPERGSHPPDTFWYYHNWDFCALGGIYERTTHSSLFGDFDRLIAKPLGMEDFTLTDTSTYLGSSESVFPWYSFRLSARDLARFGLLYLRQGQWQGTQIIPPQWIDDSIKPYSDASDWGRGGYGMLWWVTLKGRLFPKVEISGNAFAGTGYGGDYLVIIPDLDLVVVHRTYPPMSMVNDEQFGTLLNLILDAKMNRRS